MTTPFKIDSMPDTIDAAVAQWQRGFDKSPEQYHEPGKCRYCGGPNESPLLYRSDTGAITIPFTACESCISIKREEYEREKEALARIGLARFCPPDFAEPWNARLGNEELRAAAFKAFSLSTNRGLILHGGSGRCKTRVAWEIIKDVEARPPYAGFMWRFYDAFELSTKGIPTEAYSAQLITIDDLGNEPTGTKWETGLLYLLRKRCDYHRVTNITTNLSGAQMAARFFGGAAGAAILRRLAQGVLRKRPPGDRRTGRRRIHQQPP